MNKQYLNQLWDVYYNRVMGENKQDLINKVKQNCEHCIAFDNGKYNWTNDIIRSCASGLSCEYKTVFDKQNYCGKPLPKILKDN